MVQVGGLDVNGGGAAVLLLRFLASVTRALGGTVLIEGDVLKRGKLLCTIEYYVLVLLVVY